MAVFTGFSSVFSARIRKIVLENRVLSCYTVVCKQGNVVSRFLNASFSQTRRGKNYEGIFIIYQPQQAFCCR